MIELNFHISNIKDFTFLNKWLCNFSVNHVFVLYKGTYFVLRAVVIAKNNEQIKL